MSIVFQSGVTGFTVYESLMTPEGVQYLTTVLAGTSNVADFYLIKLFDIDQVEILSATAPRTIGSTVILADTVVYTATFNIVVNLNIYYFELWSSAGVKITSADLVATPLNLVALDTLNIAERIALFRNDNDPAKSTIECNVSSSVSSPVI